MEVAIAPNSPEPGMGTEAAAVRRNQGLGAALRAPTRRPLPATRCDPLPPQTGVARSRAATAGSGQMKANGKAAEERLQGGSRCRRDGGGQCASRISARRFERLQRTAARDDTRPRGGGIDEAAPGGRATPCW